ncbi:D-alanine--D-alanine ligase [Flavobacterium psychrophilum]|nr:D-alanine--D-alanine ligase [Flavobacterium psychrophilum]EKT4510419.1 D-alanine--D-alanine ligase [Flavobacterium psychrophilum]MCB6087582.1 D-alanine--D-alanine ligase [Flavobacterium psychrophilum]
MKLFLHRLTHWEYWPSKIVYFPINFLWAFYALQSKTIFFFNTSNPTIKNGGFFMESKKEIYDLIPQKYYPKTAFIKEKTSFDGVLNAKKNSNITFPLIVKPDIGLRGSAVKKLNFFDELKEYNSRANFDYLIQNLIPFPNEIGVFYVRFPNQEKGKITGIVAKEFLIVTGDGKLTIKELIKQNTRFELQLATLEKEYKNKLDEVLNKDEKLNLVPFGNHSRGSKFIDASYLISDKLTNVIHEICLQIDGFYFGRMDIMYNSIAELEAGKNFQIVEINGAASEPTHIYDPKHSIFFAWKELARHISYMHKISVENNKKGVPFLTHKQGMYQYKLHLAQNNKILNF